MDLLRSLPIGLYLEKPLTWMHRLDPRVKLGWLMTFLAAPLLANPWWRLGIVGVLILLTLLAAIPLRVWRQQMGWLLTLCILVFIITCFVPDGLGVTSQPRLPDSNLQLPQPTDYHYVLFERGRFVITRRSLELAVRTSTLIFTLIYSTNLYLLTTAPEEITAGLEELLEPVRRSKLPITEIMLTLTLSLRFIPLVLEEVQNLARSIRTRAINWKKLGVKRSLKVWLVVVERLLENLLLRAEQIAVAMEVRGFTSPNKHRVQWHQLRLRRVDWFVLFALIPFWWARLRWGGM
ncbi:ABC-type cobalt transport system, permease component CbiQ [Pleurocapsa sp. PCC 7327]|uniref:energy-coupling factor transporter transmembrane component T family protein n=1 Tax=Pleurocapsa sp. PCC 7327 TaxID=118163 RepID=UPI0002A000A7|nr:CbiQ family ECF transporter T component [Pleurocapsa sp. PCC 7327]AFY78058.1 ABC-type cobalt transport system, permease component CbiQ [Pleurocapsa sp. PCC 7327]